MENSDQIQSGLSHLRQSLSTRTHFPETLPQPCEPYFARINMTQLAPYHEPFMLNNGMAMPSGFVRSGHNNIFPSATLFGVEMESSGGGWSFGNTNGGNSRWPRQETLTLLEIRIRLDSKFKEANQKGLLWDEVSRLMAEEYGYQRSGKKCREKFENLYKYYKKTKRRKAAGRQDGSKNYRFFRQLELLYGETSNRSSRTLLCPNPDNATNQENHQRYSLQEEKPSDQSLSFSNASEFETSSFENNGEDNNDDVSAIGKKGWKTEAVKEFVEKQMNKLMDSQDAWMERMLKTIEDKDRERISKDEELKRKETALFDKEHGFWVKERAWAQARDGALMELLKVNRNRWTEHEISSLIQLRTSLEARFQENNGTGTGYPKEVLWEEIEAKIGSLGYERGAVECKAKWDSYF